MNQTDGPMSLADAVSASGMTEEEVLGQEKGWKWREVVVGAEKKKTILAWREEAVARRKGGGGNPLKKGGEPVTKRARQSRETGAVSVARLEELKRKESFVEKYTGIDARESIKLVELTDKWKEVALEALADLKRLTGVEKSDWELLEMMQVDPTLLGLEKEEEEEEEDS